MLGLEIWIDVFGIYIIDFCIVFNVVLIVEISFSEVFEMVNFGVKIFYFLILLLVLWYDIFVFVGLLKELEKGGIWICKCVESLLFFRVLILCGN